MSWDSFKDPYDILCTRLAALSPAPTIAWDNGSPFTPPAGNYVRVYYLPATLAGKSLSGKEWTPGVYQISIVTDRGQGAVPALVDTVKAWFPAGLYLRKSGGGGFLRVRRTTMGPTLDEGDRRVIPLSITFDAYEEG